MLRFHGSKAKKTFEFVGYNSRLDELQAAVLRLFLTQLDEWNGLRREAAARYAELGPGRARASCPADEPGHVYHMYVVRTPERDASPPRSARPRSRPPRTTSSPLHLQPALRFLGWGEGSLPETEAAAADNLALPLWAGITAEIQERVVETIRQAARVGVG